MSFMMPLLRSPVKMHKTSSRLLKPAKVDAIGNGSCPLTTFSNKGTMPAANQSPNSVDILEVSVEFEPVISTTDDSCQRNMTITQSQDAQITSMSIQHPQDNLKSKYQDIMTEARACVSKAKTHLKNSKNLKTEIKTEVVFAIDRLYEIVKEISKETTTKPKQTEQKETHRNKNKQDNIEKEEIAVLKNLIEKQTEIINNNNEKMENLSKKLDIFNEEVEIKTYASVAASYRKKQPLPQTALHSVIVSSLNEAETGEQVLDEIRKVVNARESEIKVDKIRKAKDRKVIISCRTEEERKKIKEKLQKAKDKLTVEEIKNKNPLVILKNVLNYNEDEAILKAIKNQNRNIFNDIPESESEIEIAYKKRTKNPHTSHIIIRTPPKIWKRIVEQSYLHVDLQRIRVEDQSPLIQCSMCLAYGHGKRFCVEKVEKCSYCGGQHMKTECLDWKARNTPSCSNCVHAETPNSDHSAFDRECPTRKKWEALARASIAYC